MEDLHEPQSRAGFQPASIGKADRTQPLALAHSAVRRDACPTLDQFRLDRRGNDTLITPGWSPALQ